MTLPSICPIATIITVYQSTTTIVLHLEMDFTQARRVAPSLQTLDEFSTLTDVAHRLANKEAIATAPSNETQ